MKKRFLLLFTFAMLGTACNQPLSENLDLMESTEDSQQEETITKNQKQSSVKQYYGSWFSVEYPSTFTASPTEPVENWSSEQFSDNDIKNVVTDEAFFLSPDKTVEFFIHSPLWGGNPESYLDIAEHETLVDETTEEVPESENTNQFGETFIYRATLKAKDGSYWRSFISTRHQVGTGSEIHHVFGIRYKDQETYNQYRQDYLDFKSSLIQYAD